MDESLLIPSPNWGQGAGITASIDNWIFYGRTPKNLCILEPVPTEYNAVIIDSTGYKAHIIPNVHQDTITSIEVSPEWPNKRIFLTGSADGTVKQWLITHTDGQIKVKTTHAHDVLAREKEAVVGAGYCNEVYTITAGSYGSIVKWDINSNVVRTYNHLLRGFKPSCFSCSRHTLLQAAVGTKQGVVFLLDLNGNGKMLYKVRAHDEELLSLSWCPQSKVDIEFQTKSTLSSRLDQIRNKPEGDENKQIKSKTQVKEPLNASIKEPLNVSTKESLNASNRDSANEFEDIEIVEEEDLFDMYKDHEDNEFGHKKYQPEDIYVKVEKDKKKDTDYLAECMKLKDTILKLKNEPEPTLSSLVDALENTHVSNEGGSSSSEPTLSSLVDALENTHVSNEESSSSSSKKDVNKEKYENLLATIGKYGKVRIWSKTGKLLASATVASQLIKNASKKGKGTQGAPFVLWLKPDKLLIVDSYSQLLQCNPLSIDCKNKIQWSILHAQHKKGLFSVFAGRSQTMEEDVSIWTVAQDWTLARYSLKENKITQLLHTAGGFVYAIATCPYDPKKVAVAVGDGGVRVLENETSDSDESKLKVGNTINYWRNVQGKVLAAAWHPSRENLLAFSTAESRIGTVATLGSADKSARAFPAGDGACAYSLAWAGDQLLAAAGDLLQYHADRPDRGPQRIPVTVEGKRWKVTEVTWSSRAMLVGSTDGAVALLDPTTYEVKDAIFPFTKIIHYIDLHPEQVSEANEQSPYKNLLAVCSLDKSSQIAILQIEQSSTEKLSPYKSLAGHEDTVYRVAWSPHREQQLLSSSKDGTVRVWDAIEGTCTGIFGGHSRNVLCVSWLSNPGLANYALSGGIDCTLRLWDTTAHPPESYKKVCHEITISKSDKKNKKKQTPLEEQPESDLEVATNLTTTVKPSKRFLLPKVFRQIVSGNAKAIKQVLKRHQPKTEENDVVDEYIDCDFVKIFGSANEVNEILDDELQSHAENRRHEAWMMLSILRGKIDDVIKYAAERNILSPFLLSITPSVSFKYFKDTTQLYLAQIDRLVAMENEHKLIDNCYWGGSVFRKTVALLAIHDIVGALNELLGAHLYPEAYILCRTRYMDSLAEETLRKWANYSMYVGTTFIGIVCLIVLGDLAEAATKLGKFNDEQYLKIAAEIAKLSGQNKYAEHITNKNEQIKLNKETTQTEEEPLKELPTKLDVLLKELAIDKSEMPVNERVAERSVNESE